MKRSWVVGSIFVLALLLLPAAGMGQAQEAAPGGEQVQALLGTAITYQGRLNDGGSPANGSYDLVFTLYDAVILGNPVGSSVWIDDHLVSDGLFTVRLDFGTVFDNQALWLAIGVRPGDSTAAYTMLTPRQELTAAPYARYAADVGPHEHWAETWSGSGTGVTVISSGGGDAITGRNEGSGHGLYGYSAGGDGLYGYTASSTHTGVSGINEGSGYGVYASSSAGTALHASTNSGEGYAAVSGHNAGAGYGVHGWSSSGLGVCGHSDDDHGVYGSSTAGYGVYGLSNQGYGVFGYSATTTGVAGSSNNGDGVSGSSASSVHAGVSGRNSGSGYGVLGFSLGGYGIHGISSSSYGVVGTSDTVTAIYGSSTGGNGVHGASTERNGIYGESNSEYYAGVLGENTAGGTAMRGITNSGSGYAAIRGDNDGIGYGVSGSSVGGHGVMGHSVDSAGVFGSSEGGYGIHGETTSGMPGVYGESALGDGVHGISSSGHGVYGYSGSTGGAGLYGYNEAGGYGVYAYGGSLGYAGYFVGDVRVEGNLSVTGALSKGSGSFRIDHPLDPQNRYLSHSFVESPDMMDIYNGNVILDEMGEAWVELPEWFEALNGGAQYRADYRYQLTPIGAPGPNLHIAAEIAGNRFQIAGGTPGMKVSWQVTGIRHDPYAEANRIQVEQAKPAGERGACLFHAACRQAAAEEPGTETRPPGGDE